MEESKITRIEQLPLALRVEDLMPVLGIGRGAAYDLVRSGKIGSVRVGRKIRIPRREVERLLGYTA